MPSTRRIVDVAVLELSDLNVSFQTNDGAVHAVRDVNLAVATGETLAQLPPASLVPASRVRHIELLGNWLSYFKILLHVTPGRDEIKKMQNFWKARSRLHRHRFLKRSDMM